MQSIKNSAIAGIATRTIKEYSIDSYAGITRIRFESPKRDSLISADIRQHPLCSYTICIVTK